MCYHIFKVRKTSILTIKKYKGRRKRPVCGNLQASRAYMQKTRETLIHEAIRRSFSQAADQLCQEVSEILAASSEEEMEANKHPRDLESKRVMKISKMLRSLGCDPSLKGYRPLAYSLLYCYEDRALIHNIIKGLYPKIAEKFSCNTSNVERMLHNCISKMYPFMPEKNRRDIVGESIMQTGWTPTNSQFLASMVDYISETYVL